MHIVFLVLSLVSFANALILSWMLLFNYFPESLREDINNFLAGSIFAFVIGMIISRNLWTEKEETVEKDEE